MIPGDDHLSVSWRWLLPISVAVLFLTIVPLPGWAMWLRPEWVVLLVVYLVLAAPFAVGMTYASTCSNSEKSRILVCNRKPK